ncbi:hypothetical protein EMCRGX_G026888 [Ephydatia muelleri]
MPSRNRKKRYKQRAEYLQKQEDILSQENKAKARARYKADPEKKASVRDSYKADPEKKKASKKASVRDSYKADPEKKKASVRDSYKADPEKKKASKKASVRDSYKADPEKKASVRDSYTQILNLSNLLIGSGIKRTSRRTVLLKGSDIKRTSRRTVLLKGRNTRTIQLPLRHLKGIGIGMTPLSDWLNVLPRGSGIAGVTELHYTTQRCRAAPLLSTASSSRAAPTATSSSNTAAPLPAAEAAVAALPPLLPAEAAGAPLLAPAPPPAPVLAPVPPPPLRLLPPWLLPPPPAWLSWPEPGCQALQGVLFPCNTPYPIKSSQTIVNMLPDLIFKCKPHRNIYHMSMHLFQHLQESELACKEDGSDSDSSTLTNESHHLAIDLQPEATPPPKARHWHTLHQTQQTRWLVAGQVGQAAWMEAWNMFSATRIQTAPQTALKLVKYQNIICQLFTAYATRQQQPSTSSKQAHHHTSRYYSTIWRCPQQVVPTTWSEPGQEICRQFNLGRCNKGAECYSVHKCWVTGCGGEHSGKACPRTAPVALQTRPGCALPVLCPAPSLLTPATVLEKVIHPSTSSRPISAINNSGLSRLKHERSRNLSSGHAYPDVVDTAG